MRSRTASRRSSFFFLPINFGLRGFNSLVEQSESYINALLPQFHSAHLDKILRNFCDALFAFVDREIRPVD